MTDPNGATTTYAYNDPLDRVTQIGRADGGQTAYIYENPTWTVQCEDQNSAGDCALQTQTAYDGLGRLAVNVTMENPSQAIRVDTTYDALGRVASRTNPSRPGDGLNFQTTYSYDALGRVTQVRTADGAIAATTYNGNSTTVADQAHNAKLYTYDALGRLTAVIEDPGGLNYGTNYFYDTQDNLIAAYQGYCPVCQGRWFAYDSLSRLTQAASNESGNTNYGYDAAGNLVTKTDARGIATTYSYDALNRLTSKSYNDGTPAVTYAYGDNTNMAYAKGRLTSISNANSTTNYTAYDSLGRVKASNEQTAGQTYIFSYSYNLAGALTSETYPSGRVVSTSYDRVNRVSSVTGSLNGETANYISQTAYWPHGGIYYYVRGNYLWHAASYNSRLQQTESYEAINNSSDLMLLVACPNWGVNSNAGVYDICPHASATNDNGNLQSVVTYAGGPGPASVLTSFSGSFAYDGVNRLTSALESGDWWRNFGYDQYGNMWVTGNGGAPLAGNTPTSNVYSGNRITGASYDAAGNQLAVNGDTLTYDAENRQVSATEPPSLGGGTETYSYDGNGQRVAKSATAGTTVYVYDAFGQLAAEYSTAAPAPPLCTTCYLSYDHLGSLRMVTDSNGIVVARHDYLPFGEEIPGGWAGHGALWGIPDEVNQKFTGKERDGETGLDYFGARYMSSAQGRFTSPDPLLNSGRPWDPQTWNRYSYARNNPLAIVDPTGLYDLNNTCASDDKKCNKQFQQHAKDLRNGLSNLQKQVDKMKAGAEKTRLQNSLKALGTEGDRNGVNVAFGATKDGAAATTDPIFDQNTGKYRGFDITIDPSKESNGANGWAIDAAHEGTHVSDFENYMLDPATAMQPFQIEYRGYQTSEWAGQALGFDNLSYRGVQIWNSSWGAVDRQTLQDKGITKVVTDKDHPEVQPHNPFPNN